MAALNAQDLQASNWGIELPGSDFLERQILSETIATDMGVDIASDILIPSDFSSHWNRICWEAVLTLDKDKRSIDPITMSEILASQPPDAIAVALEICAGFPSSSLEEHCMLLRDRSVRRKILLSLGKLAQLGSNLSTDTKQFIEIVESEIYSSTQQLDKSDTVQISEAIDMAAEEVKLAQECGEAGVTGLSTGLEGFDRMTSGMHAGELFIIAGRPGMGKSALAAGTTLQAARKNVPVLFFSLEMGASEVAKRMISSISGIDQQLVRNGSMSAQQLSKWTEAAETLYKYPITIDPTAAITLSEVRSKSRRHAARHGLGIVVVDYLQLMHDRANHGGREQEISAISRGLKQLAKELKVPVMALAQLNRGPESDKRTSKVPRLGDLRDSGSIEQDADLVGFVYRAYTHDKSAPPKEASLIIAKQRNGPCGTVPLIFEDRTTTFRDRPY